MDKLVDRDLSWLAFNQRVLEESEDERNPIIERLKFLGIFSNNLDEFFRVRVATLYRNNKNFKKQSAEENLKLNSTLKQINKKVIALNVRFSSSYKIIIGALEKNNIYIKNETELNKEQKKFVRNYFRETVRSMLVPIMLNQVSTVSSLEDHSVYLAIELIDAGRKTEYAIIEIPSQTLGRFLILPNEDEKRYIVFLDDVIRSCFDEIFHSFNYAKINSYTIKVTRDAVLEISNDLNKSFLQKISESAKKRAKAIPVRVVIDEKMSDEFLQIIINKMKLGKVENLITGGRYHNSKDFMDFPSLDIKALRFDKNKPIKLKYLKDTDSLINYILHNDMLLYYPYHSFNYMIDLLREAAIDPNVDYIKITLYRVASNSKIINALINAAKNGKKVYAFIEIQARFDEVNNINFASELQDAGVKIIFANPELKVHAKLCLIRKTLNKERIYISNISTGNYHEGSAKTYTDMSLFTADKTLTNDINKVFKSIENKIQTYYFDELIVSPTYMRKSIIDLIEKEIENKINGKSAEILIKINNLTDEEIIEKLYLASKVGVKIKLIVRGICRLIPQIKKLSENIEVISILDQYLEHTRFFIFHQNGLHKIYLASADLMERNLNERVEVLAPVNDPKIKKQLIDLFNLQWSDNVKARVLKNNNNYFYKEKLSSEKAIRSQLETYNYLKTINKNYGA